MFDDELDLGPLRGIVADRPVTDLTVTCDGRVWADYGMGMQECRPRIPFASPAVVRAYAVNLCAQLGRRLDDACPIADASSVSGIRVHAVLEPIVARGAVISIRFPGARAPDLDELHAIGVFPQGWLALLRALVRHKATILVTGGTGVGKTTLLRALLGACPVRERVVSVEEVRELGELSRDNYVSLVSREPNVEGAGAVGLTELVKATLRMRPDRVVLGECRGEEVADLLRALNSGHHGGMVTLHADSVRRVPARLISLGLLAGMDPRALAMLAEGAFDVVLHLVQRGGGRHIAQIGRLVLSRDGALQGQALATWDGVGEVRPGADWEMFARTWLHGGGSGSMGRHDG